MATLPKKLAAMVAAGLLTMEQAQTAAQAQQSQADKREPTNTQAVDGAFIPSDAGRPVTPVPDEVVITDDDIDAAIETWNDVMPEYDGLLEATEDKDNA